MEIWAASASGKLRSYLNQSELNLQCNILHSCKSERHFRSKNQAPSHGARHSRAGTPSFLCPSLILLCPEKFVLNIK